jgi:flagellar basal-body rod protein FlgF
MTRGIYTAATGMLAEDNAMQVIAQNLANASTTGYKQEVPTFKSFDETLVSLSSETGVDSGAIGKLGSGTTLDKVYTDLSDGPLQQTGNNLDVAMIGNAYLGVQTPAGTLYSRDGSLTMNAQGTLVQEGTGLPVLSDQGTTITIPADGLVKISPDGTISSGKNKIAQLALYSVTNANDPTKVGDNLISTAAPASLLDGDSTSTGFIRSGFLEASNVSVVKQMVTMIACQRSYEANSKALQSQDAMNQQSISTVGAPAT